MKLITNPSSRNLDAENSPDETSPLSPSEDVERNQGRQQPSVVDKRKVYASFAFKVSLLTFTGMILLIWDSFSDYLVALKHFGMTINKTEEEFFLIEWYYIFCQFVEKIL